MEKTGRGWVVEPTLADLSPELGVRIAPKEKARGIYTFSGDLANLKAVSCLRLVLKG
jgi:hypothetical protein